MPHISTRSANGELADGGNKWDTRSMFVQNMDVLKLSHDRRIEKYLIDVMSVPKLVVDQTTDIKSHWDQFAYMSIFKSRM